jgi:uracil-DNA glycosylase
MEWDPGPPPAIQTIFEQAPLSEYKSRPSRFRLAWGPIYYRGRLDGSAKVIVIAQDPAADENVARRCLVGHAGQRVQGFLKKLGLTRSYVLVNTILYSIFGQFDQEMETFTDLPAVRQWRNQLLDALVTSNLEAVLAFGQAARHVVDTWPGATALKNQGKVFFLTHPTAQPISSVVQNWNSRLSQVGAKVSADPDGTKNLAPYSGPGFKNSDLARIPLRDFSFGTPAWMGTGNAAIRLNSSQPLPEAAKENPTILWIAIEDEG